MRFSVLFIIVLFSSLFVILLSLKCKIQCVKMDVRLLYTQKHAHGNQMDYELKKKRMSTMEKSCNTSKKMRPHTDSILQFEIH